MKIFAIFGMVTSVALFPLPSDTKFDDILKDAAHGVLEVLDT
jgi:NADH:ubiquinone oxidoreductase subunit F (NADH-binding)